MSFKVSDFGVVFVSQGYITLSSRSEFLVVILKVRVIVIQQSWELISSLKGGPLVILRQC